ncbi:hypothetical protein DD556_17335 [Phaeobacter sp. JL2872]|nr:hypothetical protein DD556_17335 [Phaeobacter sp. JL2872]
MTPQKTVFFIINLLQDVNIIRGLAYLAARETDARIGFLVSHSFLKRDHQTIWQRELAEMAQDLGADMHLFAEAAEVYAVLQGGRGMIFAASESNLSPHRESSMVFRVAPSGYLRVTLQHGLECIGFLQSREHVMGHGRNISFSSDLVCSWFEAPALTSMIASERSKLYVSGPPTLLQRPGHHPDHPPQGGGIVCENMHSVRLKASGDHKASFMDIFFDFCAEQAKHQRNVTLRPHPGGQYVIKNNVALPENVQLNNLPIYHVNMAGYDYGISAPSTIVFDMVLAGIPVGVWRDPGGVMDAGNYDGLTEISDLESWLAFERDVRLRRDMILDRQARFLERLQMPTNPQEIYRRFASLMVAALSDTLATSATGPDLTVTRPAPPKKVLFIANGLLPTLQLCFLKPLKPLVASGEMTCDLLSEQDLTERFPREHLSETARDWFVQQISSHAPDIIVCCRYSGPHSEAILEYGQQNNVPVIFHVDDDLLNIPRELGEKKYKAHNNPNRLHTVRTLLTGADLRYYSTKKLQQRFRDQGFYGPAFVGGINCAGQILREAQPGPVRRIGYMGFDHAHDFEVALPALETYLERNPKVTFELFGSIPMPERLLRFGDRIQVIPPVRDYASFLQALADRHWDIGICPLAQTSFNEVKSNNKWVEYTASGMATIASRGLIYDDCANDGHGILVDDHGWLGALQTLTDKPEKRYAIAQKSQRRLQEHFSYEQLKDQILTAFARAETEHRGKNGVQSQPLRDLKRPLTLNENQCLTEGSA